MPRDNEKHFYPEGSEWLEHETKVTHLGEEYFIHSAPFKYKSPSRPYELIWWIQIQRKKRTRILSVPIGSVSKITT